MAQHDYVIDNQSFPATRSDLNSLFQAIASSNSGATAPSTTYANQLWYDTANNKFYIRNEDNDAWIELFVLDQTGDHLEKIGNTITLDGTGNMSLAGDLTVDTDTLFVDASADAVGIGTTTPEDSLHVKSGKIRIENAIVSNNDSTISYDNADFVVDVDANNVRGSSNFIVKMDTVEACRVDDTRNFLVKNTTGSSSDVGHILAPTGAAFHIRDGGIPLIVDRLTSDGDLVFLRQNGTAEGTISVSGTTVSYNGGHLSRWSQLTDGTKDTSIVKGTVMTNLDQMAVWSHDAVDAVEAQDAVFDDDGNLVSEAVEAVEAQDAYTEDNEQLNCMAVSSVEGDTNVAGVFVNWDYDDDDFNDMNVAMTGDMVIRIAQGTTVARGDLLMSAGDGTAKPQGDDIVRSKTIAKVTSINVSHTYDDGSYLVPCVLMAC